VPERVDGVVVGQFGVPTTARQKPTSIASGKAAMANWTWLVSDGVPINYVAKVMGHEQTSTTLDRYTHSTRARGRRVLGAFDAFSLPPADDQEAEKGADPSGEGS
jgi:hypothetical protein